MPRTLVTIRVGNRPCLVEPVAESDAYLIPAGFVLHHPRGRKYLLVPDARRPDRLVAIAWITHFSPFRPTPFPGVWFSFADDGKLAVASPDA